MASLNLGIGTRVVFSGAEWTARAAARAAQWSTPRAHRTIYTYYQIGRADNLRLKYYGRSAFKCVLSNATYRNVFCTDSASCQSAVKLFQSFGQFDNWIFDFEGGPLPSDSYFWASIGDNVGGPTVLAIRDCGAGSGSDRTALVRLVSNEYNAGLGTSARGPGWCTIERSFSNYIFPNLQAVVAVDGPLWRGTYDGVPPPRLPLAVNTTTPGASARIGIGVVPSGVSVPPAVAAGASDPVLQLPGLIGYYRVDMLRRTVSGQVLGYADGDPVTALTDQSGAANHGEPISTPAIFQSNAINGLPALQFTGGWYQFPAMHGSTGTVTAFFVAKRLPAFDTKPGQLQTLRTLGSVWQLANWFDARSANSDTEWAVYAVRYTAGPARVLQTWTNGHAYDLRRRDDAGPVQWSIPTLGTINTGWIVYRGQLTTAIICDNAVPDEQVQRFQQQLLHTHQIAV